MTSFFCASCTTLDQCVNQGSCPYGNRPTDTPPHGSTVAPPGRTYPGAIFYSGAAAYTAAPVAIGLAFGTGSGQRASPLKKTDIEVGELIGWRVWHVIADGYLASIATDIVWLPGQSMRGDPSEQGYVGVWAFKEPRYAIDKMLKSGSAPMHAYGSVYLWGTIIEHEIGYRAEFAAVRSLDDMTGGIFRRGAILKRARQMYGVGATKNPPERGS